MPRRPRRRLLSPAFLVLAIGLPSVPLAAWWVNRPPPPLPAEHVELVLAVEGLHCSVWCPIGVDTALAGMSGTELLGVDVSRGEITVAFDPAIVDSRAILRRVSARWPIQSVTLIERPSGRIRPLEAALERGENPPRIR